MLKMDIYGTIYKSMKGRAIMKRKKFRRAMAIALATALSMQSIPAYATETFPAEDFSENFSGETAEETSEDLAEEILESVEESAEKTEISDDETEVPEDEEDETGEGAESSNGEQVQEEITGENEEQSDTEEPADEEGAEEELSGTSEEENAEDLLPEQDTEVLLEDNSEVAAETRINAADFTYTKLDGNYVSVTGYTGAEKDLIIPEIIDGLTVKEIGDYAFSGSDITSVHFPDSLTKIGACGFAYCDGLTEITVPDSVTEIGHWGFSECKNLEKINYPKSLTSMGTGVYEGDVKLKNIIIPDGVEKIPAYAFENCSNFTEISMPSGLKEIDDYAFMGCSGLTKIELQEGLVRIGEHGFGQCSGLTEVVLPESLTELDSWSFKDCENLEKINYPKNLEQTGEGVYEGDVKLKSMTVPEGVETIPAKTFACCSNFTEINLPSSLKKIESFAFGECTGLTGIKLPAGLTEIGDRAFSGCRSLKKIKLPSGLTEIGNTVFVDCTELNEISFPAGVTSIGDRCFWNCTGLIRIVLPDKLEKLGEYAFLGCTALAKVSLPNSLKEIEKKTFQNCGCLTAVVIPGSVKKIADDAFEGCPNIVIYCNYYSYASAYAISKGIPFVSAGQSGKDEGSVLDNSATSYYGDFNSMTANGYVAMTVKYKIKDEQKNNIAMDKIEITMPSNAVFDETTLKVDGELCTDYTYDGERTLQIPMRNNRKEGVIRYSVKVINQTDTTSSAVLYFTQLGLTGIKTKETIGTVNENIRVFTIDAPQAVSDEAFDVSGAAPASSTVTLKIDGKEQKQVKASKAGYWSGSLQLQNPVDYQDYEIEAVCSSSGQDSETRKITVSYHQDEPVLKAFDMTYNENKQIKTRDMLNTNGIAPVVYYYPGAKFNFELAFENADQIKDLYVTSTRNGETKYLKAAYDQRKKRFVTDGYFDENDQYYVPGIISYEYNRPTPEVTVGQSVNWDNLLKKLPQAAAKNLQVTMSSNELYQASLVLSDFGEEFSKYAIDTSISIFDETNGTEVEKWKGLLEAGDDICSYIVPGHNDGEKYICNLDYSDKKTWYMLVKDVSGNKYIGLALDTAMENTSDMDKYWNMLQASSALSAVNNSASMIYKNYQIEKDMDQLRSDVLTSGYYSSTEELDQALKQVDQLENDQKMFSLMTTMLPLVMASPVAVGATMSAAPTILFTALLGAITASSSIFWNIRKGNIKGENYRSKFVIDPSGYVYDQVTGKRLENVTVTAYCIEYDESENFWKNVPSADEYGTVWDALEYNQQNPLYTNSDGKYAWDVPEGWWRVKYEKKGYKTTWSDWMTVPPLQTEVNIGMVPDGAVEAEHKWDKGTVTIKPTCTATGIIRYECQDCHQTKTEVLPIDSKNHEKTTNVVTKATVKKNGSVTKKCTACKKVVSKSIIYYPKTIKLTRTGFVYSGKVQKPGVVIRDAKNKIISSSLYTLKYSAGCKNVGRYTVRVTFKGNYSGAVSLYYQILPKGTVISAATSRSGGFTVRWKKQATQTSGYQIQYAENSSFRGARTITISKNSTTVRNILKLKKNKKYYVRIRTYRKEKGKNYYSSWSKTKAVTTKK